MRYMVMTTKHHEGFCLFDSQTHRLLRDEARSAGAILCESMWRRRAQRTCAWVSTTR